ncbi:MAG: histidine kinase [Lewinellaceae bacterium]|nr:histidine kinase [Lewinellaceae bacterium]
MQQTTTYKHFPLAAVFLAFLLLPGCQDYQHPGFEPGVAGSRPVEQLDHFLRTDSIIAGLEQLPGTREQLDSLLLWADLMKNYNQNAALEYANEANRMSTERGWRLSQAISLYYRAMIKEKKQRLGERIEDAIVDAKMSEQLLKQSGRKDWQIRTGNLLGGLYYKKSQYDSALVYLYHALEMAEKSNLQKVQSIELKGEIFHDLGNIYSERDSTIQKALNNYQKSLDIYEKTGNKAAASRLNIALGRLYTRQGEYEKAQEELRKSEAYAYSSKDYSILVDAYRRLGYLKYRQYRSSGEEPQFLEAMALFRKCLKYQEENQYDIYVLMGWSCQERTSKPPKNLAYLDSAIVFYRMAMEDAQKEGVADVMAKMANNITSLCNWRFSKFEKDCSDLLGQSYTNFLNENYKAITDTITISLQGANQRIREFERKEQAAATNLRLRKNWFISGVGLVIAGLTFLLILLWQKQKRLQARMEALRAQINPHFISNSLNAIENLVNQDQREAAAKYLIHFSRLSRQILNSSRAPSTSLTEEIKMLEHFLALEQLRFRDKLHYEIELSPGLNPDLIEMPAMILQPYVENAIWHGIKPKSGPGFLKIRIERNGRNLVCFIEDDGIGREKAREMQAASVLRKHKSQGMAITEERLKVIGKATGSRVEIIDLHDTQGHATGTRVAVRLPFKLMKNKE